MNTDIHTYYVRIRDTATELDETYTEQAQSEDEAQENGLMSFVNDYQRPHTYWPDLTIDVEQADE